MYLVIALILCSLSLYLKCDIKMNYIKFDCLLGDNYANSKEEKKIGRPPAKWLLKLKPGVYSTEDLVMISKRDRNTVEGRH